MALKQHINMWKLIQGESALSPVTVVFSSFAA